MQNEFGAYLPIELPMLEEMFNETKEIKVERFDCGRNAIAAVALSVKPDKLYIPYYNCDTVSETLIRNNIKCEFYYLDDELNPSISELGDNDWILWVNYLGNCRYDRYEYLKDKYSRIIFDNTQALFAEPVIGKQCFNVYSPRKFVGVSDGAYVVWGNTYEMMNDFPEDISWERSLFLLKSIETGTNSAYQDNLKSMEHMGLEIRKMSKLTQRILASIDYEKIKMIRNRNIEVLHEGLKNINKFPFEINDNLMSYPLYIQNDSLRKRLIEMKVYVSQWWKYLIPIVPENSVEARFSKWLLPLPIDQRYNEEDMLQLTDIVLKCYNDME